MKFTEENIKKIEKFIEIKNRGYYANGTELQVVYNEVFEVNKPATNCGSCIRQRITELENALNAYKRSKISSPVEGNKSVEEPKPTTMKVEEENKPVIKKAGRPKKK